MSKTRFNCERRARQRNAAALMVGVIILAAAQPALAWHDTTRDVELRIAAPLADVAVTLMLPEDGSKQPPCVIIVGGTLSHDRNGRMERAGAPPRDALQRLATALAAGGYASLRYDAVGHGGSRPRAGWTGTYTQQADVLAAAVRLVRDELKLPGVIVAGESAGAYVACLAAKNGVQADAYLFLGGLAGSSEQMYEYNFGRLATLAESSAGLPDWARGMRYELALGRHYKVMLQAAARGETKFELVDGDFHTTLDLSRRKEELDMPPDKVFAHIKSPALALAGEHDLNVPPEHARRAVEVMQAAGNRRAEALTIAGADHSFQQSAETDSDRLRERHTLASFRRLYQAEAYRRVVRWLRATVPTPIGEHPEMLDQIAKAPTTSNSAPAAASAAQLKLGESRIDPLTANTPERVQLAPGIEIIDDVTDRKKTAGVETLEGRIGPLLLAEGCQAHFIDMPAGMYLKEHSHSSESIIFTVRGSWVLCSQEKRHVMKAGSLFRFTAGTPTGYEVPFAEPAFILIFKGDRTTKQEKEFIDYLSGMAQRLDKEHKEGIPYLLKELPADHPARLFAKELDPTFK